MIKVDFKPIRCHGPEEGPDNPCEGNRQVPDLGPRALAVLIACALLTLCELYVSISLGPAVGEDLGVHGASGLMGTSFGLAYAAGVLVFGPLATRHGARRVLIAGHVALAAATLLVALSPSAPALVAARVAQGAAAATFPPVALAYLGAHAPPARRPVLLAAMTSTFLLAGIVGQLYGGAFDGGAWRTAFLGLAGGHLLGAALMTATLHPGRRETAANIRLASQLLGALRTPHLPRLLLALSTVLLAFVAMYASLASGLRDLGSTGADLVAIRIAGVPGMLLAPAAGLLVPRLGPARVAVSGLLVAAAGLVLEAAAGTVPALVAGSAIFVAGVAIAVPAFTGLIGDRAGERRGAALALYSCVLFVGASLGSAAGSYVGLAFAPLCGALAVLLCLAAAAVWTSRDVAAGVRAGGAAS